MNTYLAQISGSPSMPRWEFKFLDMDDADAIKWIIGIVERGDIPPMAHGVTVWQVAKDGIALAEPVPVALIEPRLTAVVIGGSVRKFTGTARVS